MDQRNNSIAAEVRAGLITREEGLKRYHEPPYLEPGLVDYFKKRLQLTDEEFEAVMTGPRKTYQDYKTYKKLFERLRPLFYLLAKRDLVPMSFYLKYCMPEK